MMWRTLKTLNVPSAEVRSGEAKLIVGVALFLVVVRLFENVLLL